MQNVSNSSHRAKAVRVGTEVVVIKAGESVSLELSEADAARCAQAGLAVANKPAKAKTS